MADSTNNNHTLTPDQQMGAGRVLNNQKRQAGTQSAQAPAYNRQTLPTSNLATRVSTNPQPENNDEAQAQPTTQQIDAAGQKQAAQQFEQQRLVSSRQISQDSEEVEAEQTLVKQFGQKGTAEALRLAWLNLIDSFGATLIYIDLHFLGRYIANSKFFSNFGQEWSEDIPGGKALAGGAGAMSAGEGAASSQKDEPIVAKTTKKALEYAEIIAVIYINIVIVLVITITILSTILNMLTPVMPYIAAYVAVKEFVGGQSSDSSTSVQ